MVVGEMVQEVDLAIIGGGPGGYSAALRAAELGIKTVLVDEKPKLGGVCLHMGCIPSKSLLHAAELILNARHASKIGLKFAEPELDLPALRNWKQGVLDKLAQGVAGMCKAAGVEVMVGKAVFNDSRSVRVDCPGESAVRLKFKHCILATGSRPTKLPFLFKNEADMESPRVLDSTSALNLDDIPKKLIIIGGGYIGLELGTVYSALGSEVTVVEMTDGLIPGCDRDLVRPLATKLGEMFKGIHLSTKVTAVKVTKDGVEVSVEGKDVPPLLQADKVLIAVGRRPNSDGLGLENTQVQIDKQGFVTIDQSCRTDDKRILAIGDVSGQPMLAHRAIRQAYVAAEVLAGKASSFDNRCIPAVIFTEPEVAWCGLNEAEAKAKGIAFQVAKFPWSASGRAMTLADTNGTTKILFAPDTTEVLGVGIVGPRAGDLITEAVVAIEMGAVLEDLAVAIHPHPTLSETINEAALAALARLDRQRGKEVEKQITSP